MKAFLSFQLNQCSDRRKNNRVIHVHEKPLHVVYNYTSSNFTDGLQKIIVSHSVAITATNARNMQDKFRI